MMMMRTILRLAFCWLALFTFPLSGQEELSMEEEIIVHVRPADISTLSTEEEQEFLSATTFGARFYEAGDLEAALQQLRVADKLMPGHPALLYNLAVVLARHGQLAEAEVRIDMYRALYPDGEEMPRIRKLQIDLEWLREVQSRATVVQAYRERFDRGTASFRSGDYTSAMMSFQQARQSLPDDPAATFNQAICAEAVGDYAAASDLLGQVAAFNSVAVNRTAVDARIALLNAETADQQSSIVCSFCGRRLSGASAWCPDCGHGPFVRDSAQWSTRSCTPGAAATRSSFDPTGTLRQSESLACLYSGSYADALGFSTPKRRAIQAARKAEGWSYSNDRITSFRSGEAVIELQHDGEHLARIASTSAGDLLIHTGRLLDNGRWQVESEDRIIDGQRYHKKYMYDGLGRVAREAVRYQGANACGNVIEVRADLRYEGEQLRSVALEGGYEGYASEGSPVIRWTGTVAYTYDAKGLVRKEDLSVNSFEKTWTKLSRDTRRDLERIYPGLRADTPVNLIGKGDICGSAGAQPVINLIDLRAFDAFSPNLSIALPPEVSRVSVDFTYAE